MKPHKPHQKTNGSGSSILTIEDFEREFISIRELSDQCEVEPSRIRQICREINVGFMIGTVRIIPRVHTAKIVDACLRSRKKLAKSS